MAIKAFDVITGHGGLPMLKLQTPWSSAEIYLHGAHVANFQKHDDPPLLFMSRKSLFEPGKAIRGGVPICFPWFGARAGEPSHGVARLLSWDIVEAAVSPDARVRARLRLPQNLLPPEWAPLRTEFVVLLAETLTMELITTNESPDKTLEMENCLHNYFHVGDINAVSIVGLQGTHYLDTAGGSHGEHKVDSDAVLKITKETDRVYLGTTKAVEIRDEKYHRIIRVEKSGSRSTVVWNPWTTKKMDDFDSAEHDRMVCVEAGNVKENKIVLAPGATTSLHAVLSTLPLK